MKNILTNKQDSRTSVRNGGGGALLTNSRRKVFAVIALTLLMSVCFTCVVCAEGEAVEDLNSFVELLKSFLNVAANIVIVAGIVVLLYSFVSHDNAQRWGGVIAAVMGFLFKEVIELFL